jgi:ATP-dependent RNA helicase DeaD
MMFSATISADLDYLAKKYTKNAVEVAVSSYVDPTKLKQVYYDVPDHQKFSLLISLLKKEDADLVMVFCNTRRNVDFIANNLIKTGINAKAIHGRIEQKKRIKILDEFHKKGLGVLVCTDVAARGLDIKGVSHVYNYDVPKDTKDYIHRIGRTARAGKEGKAIIILASRDYQQFGNMMRKGEVEITPEPLPELENVRIHIETPGPSRGFGRQRSNSQYGRNDSHRGPRRDSRGPPRGRSSYGRSDSRGSGDDRPRRSDSRGRGFSRGPRRDSRGPPRGRSSYGRSDSIRNGPRRDSRRSSGPRR